MSDGAEVYSLYTKVEAKAGGFDSALGAIVKGIDAFVTSANRTLQRLPEAVAAAAQLANQRQLQAQRQHAQELERLHASLEDRENKQTKDGVEYRIAQIEREAQAAHDVIVRTVKDQHQQWELMQRNARVTELEITAVRRAEADRRAAIAKQEADRRAAIAKQEADRQIAEAHRAAEQAKREQEARTAAERNAFRNAGAAIGGAGLAMGVGGAALAADLKASSDVAREFDRNMRNVDSVLKMTDAQFRSMSAGVLDLTRTIPKSAADLSSGLNAIAQNGLEGAEALAVLELSGKAATAGLATTDEAVQALTGTMNAYNLKTAPDAARITNVLFKTVEAGVVSFSQLSAHLGMVTATAANAQQPIETVGAAVAQLTLQGQTAGIAIQGLNSLLLALQNPTHEGVKMAERLGLAWYTQAKAGRHLKEVGLEKVLKEIGEATKGDATLMHELLGQQEAVRTAQALMVNEGKAFAATLKDMANAAGALDAAYERQARSYDTMAQFAQNASDRIRIAFGAAFLDAISPGLIAATKLADAFTKLPEPVQKAVGLMEAGAAAALLLAGGLAAAGFAAAGLAFGITSINAALAVVVGWLAEAGLVAAGTTVTLGGLAATAGGAFLTAMGAAAGALSALAGPLMMVAALAAALWAAWELNLGGIQDYTAGWTDALGDLFQDFTRYASELWAAFWGLLTEDTQGATNTIGGILTTFWNLAVDLFATALAVLDALVRGGLNVVATVFGAFGAAVGGGWKGFVQYLQDTFGGGMKALAQWAKNGLEVIKRLFKQAAEGISQIVQGIGEALANPKNWKAALAKMKGGAGSIGSAVVEGVRDGATLANVAFDAFKNKLDQATGDIAAQAARFKGKVAGAFTWKGGELPAAPGAGRPGAQQGPGRATGITDRQGPGVYGDREFLRDFERMKHAINARRMGHEEAIKQLHEFEKKHKLSKEQQDRVEEEVARHEKALAAEKKRAAASGASAAKHAAAEAAKAEQKAQRERVEAVKEAEADIVNEAKEGATKVYEAKREGLEKELADLERLLPRAADAAQKRQIESRIAAIRGELSKMREERAAAEAAIEDFVADAALKRQADGFAKAAAGIRSEYAKRIAEAKKHGADAAHIELLVAERRKDIAAKADEIRTKASRVASEARMSDLSRELLAIEDRYDRELEQIRGLEDEEARRAELTDARRVEQGRAAFKAVEDWVGKAGALLATLADGGTSALDKLGAVAAAAFAAAHTWVADRLGPAFLDFLTQVDANGEAAFVNLGAAISATAGQAASAVSSMAGAFATFAGPGGVIAAVAAGVMVVGAALSSLFNQTDAELRKKLDAARSMRQEYETLKASVYGTRLEQAQVKFKQAQENVAADPRVREYQDRIAALKAQEQALAQKVQKGAGAFGEGLMGMAMLNQAKDQLVKLGALRLDAELEVNDRIATLRDQAAKAYFRELEDLQAEEGRARVDIVAGALEEEGNHEAAAMMRRAQEWDDYHRKLLRLREDGVISAQQFDDAYDAHRRALDAKYFDDLLARRLEAARYLAEFYQGIDDMVADAAMHEIELAHLTGRMTEEAYKAAQSSITAEYERNAIARELAEVDALERELDAFKGSEEERKRLLAEVEKRTAGVQTRTTEGLKRQVQDYTSAVEEAYRKVADEANREREALERQRDIATRVHEDRLRQLNREERGLQRQVDAIERITKALQDRYAAQRLALEDEDKTRFEAALSAATLTDPTDLSFETIDQKFKDLETKRRLERMTAEEFASQAGALQIQRAALAQKELNSTNITFRERVAAQDRLADAYEKWRDIQLDLIAEQEKRETAAQKKAATGLEDKLTAIRNEKQDTQDAIEDINASYEDQFDTLDRRIRDNETAWKAALESIRTGTDTNVGSMVAKWDELYRKIGATLDIAKAVQGAGTALGSTAATGAPQASTGAGSTSGGSTGSAGSTQAPSSGTQAPASTSPAAPPPGVQGTSFGGNFIPAGATGAYDRNVRLEKYGGNFDTAYVAMGSHRDQRLDQLMIDYENEYMRVLKEMQAAGVGVIGKGGAPMKNYMADMTWPMFVNAFASPSDDYTSKTNGTYALKNGSWDRLNGEFRGTLPPLNPEHKDQYSFDLTIGDRIKAAYPHWTDKPINPYGLNRGGLIVRGGEPGKDSVPARLMPGEMVADRELTDDIRRLVEGLRRALPGGLANLAAGLRGGASYKQVSISIPGVVVRSDQDITTLARAVGREVAREY